MWQCPNCKEKVEDTYRVCWACGTTPEGEKDPDFQAGVAEREYPPAQAAVLKNYRCARCGHDAAEIEVVRAATGWLSKLIDVDAARFSAVTCERCRHTEFFKAEPSRLKDIFDLLAG